MDNRSSRVGVTYASQASAAFPGGLLYKSTSLLPVHSSRTYCAAVAYAMSYMVDLCLMTDFPPLSLSVCAVATALREQGI